MFNQYSRTQLIDEKGIYFYEQDVIYDDYSYQGDMIIDITLNYYYNGFGIVLFPQPGQKMENQKTNYLFKISGQEISVYLRNNETLTKVKSNSISITPPLADLQLKFSKVGKKITITHNKQQLLVYQLPTSVYKQSIGYYSNKGNVIKSISVASKIPKNWSVNMANTLGGRIGFEKDAFKLEGCINNAEIMQNSVPLKEGTYYLKYNHSEECDIVPFVLLANDEDVIDEEKNLLTDNHFTLHEEAEVILKFTGKYGSISQIQLSRLNNAKYISTTENQHIFGGSNITVSTRDLTAIDLDFELINKPYEEFATHIISNLIESYDENELNLQYKKAYHLNFNCLSKAYSFYSGENKIKSGFLENSSSVISLFKNIEADITHFIITYKNGATKDITSSLNNIELVDNTLLSPIIVLNSSGDPMDLSASFRKIFVNNHPTYLFTNVEREVFDIDNNFYLSKDVSNKPGSVKVYGVPLYAKYNTSDLYTGTAKNIHDLSAYCNNYVTIDYDKFSINENNITIDYVELQKYKKIIIDYDKDNSYCINYNYKTQVYEVEITEDGYKIIYDKANYNSKNSTSSQKEDMFKYTSIKPLNKQYIVLRKDSE